MEADFRVDSIFVDEELGEMFAKCYDNVYGDEFEKYLGSPDTEEGRQNALTILEDSTYTMTDELRNEFISTFGLDDYGEEIIEVDEEDDFYDDSEDEVVESFSLREALNQIDIDTDNKYDLLNLYESCDLKENEKRVLANIVYDQEDPSVIYDTLNNRYVSGEEIEESKSTNDEINGRIIEFPNGDYFYVNKTGNTLSLGSATNNGFISEYEIDYDDDLSLDMNLQNLYDYALESNPQLMYDPNENDDLDESKSINEGMNWTNGEEEYEIDSTLASAPINSIIFIKKSYGGKNRTLKFEKVSTDKWDSLNKFNDRTGSYESDKSLKDKYMDGATWKLEKSIDESKSINESANTMIYLFPELTDEDLEMLKAYGLQFLGINHGADGSEENWVVRGQEAALRRYADKYLGYELHPSYLYDEEDFAGDIEPLKESITHSPLSTAGPIPYAVKLLYQMDKFVTDVYDSQGWLMYGVPDGEFEETTADEAMQNYTKHMWLIEDTDSPDDINWDDFNDFVDTFKRVTKSRDYDQEERNKIIDEADTLVHEYAKYKD